ncbi:hypothetical protein K450DRAFT_253525 [Umbelopsis ramanniana AG]|uniref:Yeast cell wall synthesis Kre9/Knh1-like N-terminal domain-containing protein n=1 Tax=Umbelopsis ramanniana AG TaxID=1314678 RepID=A0AAD5E5E9_UMBRA|nr:uncharacterized protein K450DRAFT_253525 [Umbelopsis ramanniana AG]KAI8577074.1 hypothetical protein K450DRAFT_253525 [Umbelopsis ramanniana AG]
MVSYTLISTVFAAIATAVSANMAPSEPAPGTIWTIGQSGLIQWADDSTSPALATDWKKFKIDFMTGDNTNQILLSNVATGLDGTAATTYNWTCPDVDVHSAIYFFMFTSLTKPTDMAWTTRFAIVGADGVQTAPANSAQPDGSTLDGKAIPWGVGHLVNSANASASAATNSIIASTAPALSLSSAAPAATDSGAAVSAAGSSPAAASPSTSQKSSASKVLTTAGLGLAAVAAVMMAM